MRPYMTSFEQVGFEKGLKLGLLESVAILLADKFGASGKRLMPRVREIHDVDELRALLKAIPSAETLQEIRDRLPPRGD